MGIHTSIYRVRDMHNYDHESGDKYEAKIFKNGKELPLHDVYEVREEFYLGKSAWGINEWLYRRILKKYSDDDRPPEEELSYREIHNESLWVDDLKDLLKVVKKVLAEPERAEEVLPMPKDLVLWRAKKECYDAKLDKYLIRSEDDLEKVPRAEMYDNYYYDNLRHVAETLETLIRENDGDLIWDYVVDVG